MSDLAERIRSAACDGSVVNTSLKTDQRVLARITDGIYRQPSSALRELIANSYDADASRVTIHTDAPRFGYMSIRDDGRGMSAETLAHVLEHIGGSLKRTVEGASLDVTDEHNTDRSPSGRKLIGRIGIGLFSVAQLTSHFQIITKVRGEPLRRIADIVLSPESVEHAMRDRGSETDFETGSVRVWSVPAEDVDSCGTEIVLMDLRPQTRDILTSRARWAAVKPTSDLADSNWLPTSAVAPTYHVGGLDFSVDDRIETPANLPWGKEDSPKVRFEKLVNAVRVHGSAYQKPDLSVLLDDYLRMLWTLALSVPLPYIKGHPFDVGAQSNLDAFQLSNSPKGQAAQLELSGDVRVRDIASLSSPAEFEDVGFEVDIDGVSLARPIVFSRVRESGQVVSRDLIFVGRSEPNLSSVPPSFRGGRLRFEAYLYWSNKVVPKEHNGVLVRVRGASGTLFDSTFMGYQVAEQTRLKQISGEIFVLDGLEGALNIDRESFNYANIHYQYLSRWLHGAIRQLTNKHKQISSEALQRRRTNNVASFSSSLRQAIEESWESLGGDGSELPEVHFAATVTGVRGPESASGLYLRRSVTVDAVRGASGGRAMDSQSELRLGAIMSILAGYGLLEGVSLERQEHLAYSIGRVLMTEVGNA